MDNKLNLESKQSIHEGACQNTNLCNKNHLGSSGENILNGSSKKSLLNTDSLDVAMQELLDICQQYNEKSAVKSNDCRDKSNKSTLPGLTDKISAGRLNHRMKIGNNCDITNKQNNKLSTMNTDNRQKTWSPDTDDYNSIERLQQKQTELQSQLDEVMQIAKKLENKQKRKLKCILEDVTAEDLSIDDGNDDEDELIEFQQIENELRISEINRQLDNIQEELRVRLYRRLLSNTNQGNKNLQQKTQLTAIRRGSQTDESSPSSSSCSEEPTMSTTSSIEVGISTPVQSIVSCQKKDTNDSANESITSHHDSKISHVNSIISQPDGITPKPSLDHEPPETLNQSSSGHYDQIKNPMQTNRYSDCNTELFSNETFAPSANYPNSICQSGNFGRDLERIEEDEEDCLDHYNNSEHYRTIYQEKLSPVIYGNIKTDQTSDANQIESDFSAFGTTPIHYQERTGCHAVNSQHSMLNQSDNTSSFNSTGVGRRSIVGNEVKKTNRPLTLYLPKPDEEIDLLEHVQALGHDLNIISDDLTIDSSSARGYLWKCCSKNKKWLKRYFYFDRNAKTLSYYESESHLVKRQHSPKNSIAFDKISDVYVDHKLSGIGSRDRSSKKRNYVFALATVGRKYLLASSRAETMRAWIDVLFTAADATEYIEQFDASAGGDAIDATDCMNSNQV